MMLHSRAAPAVFGEPGVVLPIFPEHPHAPHGLGCFLLVTLLVCYAEAASYHQFIHGDGLPLNVTQPTSLALCPATV